MSTVLSVQGGAPLRGRIRVRGAKNLVSKAMVAALLGESPSRAVTTRGATRAAAAGVGGDGTAATKKAPARKAAGTTATKTATKAPAKKSTTAVAEKRTPAKKATTAKAATGAATTTTARKTASKRAATKA